jgi:hypothetical protein
MPKAFDRCVKAGGRVRRKDLGEGKYVNFCFLKGKSYRGYVKTSEQEKGNKYTGALAND